MTDQGEITVLLQRARDGDELANEALMPLVYSNLRSIAAAKLRGRPGHTLQPTALVHEAYLRALGRDATFENRRHFFFVASRAMRDILIDRARRQQASKRGGGKMHVALDDIQISFDSSIEELVALDQALSQLEKESPRQHQLVMLRYFGGLSAQESAEVIGVGLRTVERDWRFARAYLHNVLSRNSSPPA